MLRLDPRVDHQRVRGNPSASVSMNASIPCTSAAGLLRVNVTHRKLLSDRAAKSAIVDDHDQRKALSQHYVAAAAAQNCSIAGSGR